MVKWVGWGDGGKDDVVVSVSGLLRQPNSRLEK